MEAPSRGDPSTIKDAQVALFRAVAEADPAHYVRGQYEGYRSIDGVAKDSTTETFAALRLDIESWRWAGVPFFIRTGKRLPITQTELRLVFKHPPKLGFGLLDRRPEENQLVVRLDPTTGIRLTVEAHRADMEGSAPVNLDMEFAQEGGEGPTPYEVLLEAAMRATARGSPDRTGSRRRGACSSRCWIRRRPSTRTRRARGGPRRPTGSSRASAGGTSRG